MHTNLAFYSSTSVIKLLKVVLSKSSHCNIISQSSFISFTTLMACSLSKLKHSILLVMYSCINAFYCVMNSKYSITLLFFGSNSQGALLLRPCPSISTANVITEGCRTCLMVIRASFHMNNYL